MAIHRSTDADGCTVTFVLTDEDSVSPVSVVGSFNDWTPGAHRFEANWDGSRSVTVVVSTETDVYFRYLGPDGFWFDDPDADEINAEGSVLRVSTYEISVESSPETGNDSADGSAFVSADDSGPGSAVADSDADDDSAAQPAAADDSDGESTPEEDQPAAHDETGERLETVADRIDDAEDAVRELADRDLIDASAVEEHRDAADHGEHAPTSG
jgi:hypothetical protein